VSNLLSEATALQIQPITADVYYSLSRGALMPWALTIQAMDQTGALKAIGTDVAEYSCAFSLPLVRDANGTPASRPLTAPTGLTFNGAIPGTLYVSDTGTGLDR
jgi:hypothetical protein